VSGAHPEHACDGFDITSEHYPHKAWLPNNVSLHVWDVHTAVPEEYSGVYDVVHIRAFTSCIVSNKVEPVLEKLLKLLKPGGYLQWVGSRFHFSANSCNT
jgi:chemotaxis methyl-accepting protein methylase